MPDIRRFLPIPDDRYIVLSNPEVQEFIQILSPHKIGKEQLWFLDAMDFVASIMMKYVNSSMDEFEGEVTGLIAQLQSQVDTKAPLDGAGAFGTWDISITGSSSPTAWADITGKPSTFPPSAHTHSASDIVSGTFANARISQASVTQHQAALTVGWGQLTSIPVFATRWPAWAEVTDKPTTFAPSAHTHAAADITSGTLDVLRVPNLDTAKITTGTFANARIAVGNVTQHQAALSIGWGQLTSIPAFATRWPTWTEVTSKPTTFAPSAHTHPWSDITATPTTLAGYGITNAASLTASNTFTGTNNSFAVSASVQAGTGNAHYWLRDNTGGSRGLFFWNAAADEVRVRPYPGGVSSTDLILGAGYLRYGTDDIWHAGNFDPATKADTNANLSAWSAITPSNTGLHSISGHRSANLDTIDTTNPKFISALSTATGVPSTSYHWQGAQFQLNSNYLGQVMVAASAATTSNTGMFFRATNGTPTGWGPWRQVWDSSLFTPTAIPTQTEDFFVDKANARIQVGISGVSNGGIANYAAGGTGDVGLYSEHAAGTVRLRPNGRGSAVGQVLVTTSGMTWAGNDIWHAGNFNPALYATLAGVETFTGRKTFAPGGGGFSSLGNFHSLIVGDRPGADGLAGILINPLGTQGGVGINFQVSTELLSFRDWGNTGAPVRWSVHRTTGDVTMTGGFTNNVNFQSGLNFGSQVGATESDLSKHIRLWGTTFGINVTSGQMNFVTSGQNASLASNGVFSSLYLRGRLITTNRNAATTLSDTHVNTIVEKTNNAAYTYTLAAGAGAQGDVITVINSGTAGNITIARASGVALYKGGTNANLTVSPGTSVNLYRSATADRWIAL